MRHKTIKGYLAPYWLTAIISPLFMFGEVICDLVLVRLMGTIVNDGVLAGNQDIIIQKGLTMLLVAALGGFMGMPTLGIFTDYANVDWSNFVFNLVFCAPVKRLPYAMRFWH